MWYILTTVIRCIVANELFEFNIFLSVLVLHGFNYINLSIIPFLSWIYNVECVCLGNQLENYVLFLFLRFPEYFQSKYFREIINHQFLKHALTIPKQITPQNKWFRIYIYIYIFKDKIDFILKNIKNIAFVSIISRCV